MSARPTYRQLSVLRAIHELTREQGAPPTMRAVAARVGCSVEVAWEEIHALRARGHLAPAGRGVPRSLRLTNRGLQEIGAEVTVEVPRRVLEEADRALGALRRWLAGGDWYDEARAEVDRILGDAPEVVREALEEEAG